MTLRDRQKEQGRALIRDAAEELFISNGYTATPVTAIAEKAGVAEKTVYNLFETKSGLLIDLFRNRVLGARDESIERQHDEVETPTEADEIIDRFCSTNEKVAARAMPLVRVVIEAAAVDSEVARLANAQEQFRFEDQSSLLTALRDQGHLRTDRPFEELQRSLWLAAAPELVIKAIDAGWTLEDHTEWTKQILKALLLPKSPRTQG
ncbi:MAG TPA: helix-turn-helix domain-containing protein [Acidimicrobiia bacterium]|nr:helix-turn-helix domain-containing protein [Acidimicrobiia bacterium]